MEDESNPIRARDDNGFIKIVPTQHEEFTHKTLTVRAECHSGFSKIWKMFWHGF
jgi:hypothetical protein